MTQDPKAFGLPSSQKFPQSPLPDLLSSLHPSAFLLFYTNQPLNDMHMFYCYLNSGSELQTAFKVSWVFCLPPSSCSLSLPLFERTQPCFQVHLIRRSRDGGLWYANETLLSSLTFVIKPNGRSADMKRWQLSPSSASFCINSPLQHIGLSKPLFTLRSKGYTQQRKVCMGKKKHVAHTNIYFYTVKTTDWSASIRCEKCWNKKRCQKLSRWDLSTRHL